jgi:hypothetical protein
MPRRKKSKVDVRAVASDRGGHGLFRRFFEFERFFVNRVELQTMAAERVLDVEALIRGKRWSFAYYVAGYTIECALKSCLLARMIHTGWVFQEKAKIADCLTHDFQDLISLAGMKELLNEKLAESAAGSRAFVENWDTVLLWKSSDRYDMKTRAEAVALRDAIIDKPDGLLPWIMKYW